MQFILTKMFTLLFVMASAFSPLFAQGSQGSDPSGSLLSTGIMFGSIIVIFYFMIIRPQQKRQKELKSMMEAMKKGDKVVTSSGIHGSISELDETTVVVNVSDNTKIRFDKTAITSIVAK